MSSSIMILGASVYQLPLIRIAKQKGLKVLVVSPNGNYPGISLADYYFDFDTTDTENILNIAYEHNILGIVTTGTDVCIPTIGRVVDVLSLYGPKGKVAEKVSYKTAFRKFQFENQLNCPDFVICRCEHDLISFFKETGKSVVVKPDDSSGSRGVSILGSEMSEKDLIQAYNYGKKYSKNGLICAEILIPGEEVGGDAFFENGKLIFFAVTCKHMDGLLVQGHSLPEVISSAELAIVKEEISRVATKLGYRNGPINFDVMVDKDKATIIELGLRNGGNGIIDLIEYSYGINLLDWLLAYTLNEPVPQKALNLKRKTSSYVFGSSKRGIIKDLPNLELLKSAAPEVLEIVLAKQVGSYIEPLINNANLIGYILLNCGSADYNEITLKVQGVLNEKVVVE